MRILHVAPSFYPAHLYGGPVVSLYRLALCQRAAGHDVRVLTSDANGRGERLPGVQGRWVEEHGVPTWYARALLRQDYSAEIGWRLPSLVRWAELVHVTAVFSPTSMLALATGAALRRPLALSPRGLLLPFALHEGGRPKRAALRALVPLLRRVAGWHVTSEEEGEALFALRCAAQGAVIAVVENGVDPGEPGAAAEGPAKGGPTIAMLGRLDPIKGIDLAFDALSALLPTHPGARLILAGPDRDGHGLAYKRQAERRGLPVSFPGLVVGADKVALLAGCDVLWLCSRMESFGNVVIEALSAGTPVVAVRPTPWRWLVEAGVGCHVAPEAVAVAAATAELLAAKSTAAGRTALRTRCREAAGRFAWPAIARRMDDLYDRAGRAAVR